MTPVMKDMAIREVDPPNLEELNCRVHLILR